MHHASRLMERHVRPELLDELPPGDPRAIRSRRDLERINAWMGNHRLMAAALAPTSNGAPTRRLLELGAGDGRFTLSVARRLPDGWRGTQAWLLDRLDIVTQQTRQELAALGWRAESVLADALAWLERPGAPECDAILANLFLHHFEPGPLSRILHAAAQQARSFIALEPRRSRAGAFMSRWLWLIGCNSVTRHDARVSVRAGFDGDELSQLWPKEPGWKLLERPAGRFGHLFIAQRAEEPWPR